jgi:hypothetical protein
MAELNFNAEEYEPMGSFDPLPVGEYVVVIESSEKKPASTGKGEYLQLVYNVIDGEYQGRRLFDRLNIENESEQAQTIARRALSSICRAIGIMNPKTSEELHDKPFVVKVGIRPAKGEYGPSNKITEYKSTDGTLPSVPEKKTEKKSETTNPATSAKKKMPWQKK